MRSPPAEMNSPMTGREKRYEKWQQCKSVVGRNVHGGGERDFLRDATVIPATPSNLRSWLISYLFEDGNIVLGELDRRFLRRLKTGVVR